MTGVLSGCTPVDHVDGGLVITVENLGSLGGNRNWGMTAQRYLACLAAVTAAMSSASAELVAVIN